jgi:ribonuclease HII
MFDYENVNLGLCITGLGMLKSLFVKTLQIALFCGTVMKKFFQKIVLEAGCDEAGRGCLAGPVYAGAVILPSGFYSPLVHDSKKMTHEQRLRARDIIQNKAISWAVGSATHEEIDRINILNASFLAMHRAIDGLSIPPELLLIDGNRFKPYKAVKHQCIIAGDDLYFSIAAASILAKTYRDEFMQQLHVEFPVFNWYSNKAYATPDHCRAIKEHGVTPYHRRTFNRVMNQLEMSF